jgi:hypothetical protein
VTLPVLPARALLALAFLALAPATIARAQGDVDHRDTATPLSVAAAAAVALVAACGGSDATKVNAPEPGSIGSATRTRLRAGSGI